ncbi:phosphate transporter, putative [Ricinus communis]|uniref:Phosphate transporter n=1 Tax=Ricinus communis TaxID=3988 RepID=B9S8D5_RICCO|nr:phosphate transporter, putative [Ricinus communis]
MPSNNDKIPIELAIRVIGKWKETFSWIPIFGAFAAVAVAFSTGANNLPAPFSTPIGSGALSLFKALIMACLIYAPAAAFAGNHIVNALISDFVKENQPNEGFLMWSMVVVLATTAIWLALSTYLELPVSSLQSIHGALLGILLVNEGFSYVPMWNKNGRHSFNGGGLVWVLLEWTVAPLVACLCSYLFFTLLKAFLLRQENAEKRIFIFLLIDYGISAGLLCLFVMFQIIGKIVSVNRWVAIISVSVAVCIGVVLSSVLMVPLAMKKLNTVPNYKSEKQNGSMDQQYKENQDQRNVGKEEEKTEEDPEDVLKEFMQMRILETVYEEEERSWASPDIAQNSEQTQSLSEFTTATTSQSAPFKQLLESTPNRLVQTRNFQRIEKPSLVANASRCIRELAKSIVWPDLEYDRLTLIRHALAEKYDEIEDYFSFPHLLASCLFAFIQSVTEVSAVVSPYGAILDVFEHRAKYSGNGQNVDNVHVKWWFRAIGGFVTAMGFFLCGWRLTNCLGGKFTYISNSRGLVSQLSSVAAIIIVTKLNLPVSSVHAFIGSLLGVGMADDLRNVNWKLLMKFICGWMLTIVFCCGIAYVIFSASIHSPSYVVP